MQSTIFQNNPKVSVLLSVYNDEKNIDRSIESILVQTYTNLEVLILDDCSTDNTFNICNKFKKLDKRIKLFRNDSNIGLTRSLNKLISAAEGEVYARQDSDDYSYPQRIEKQLIFMRSKKIDLCGSQAITINSGEKFPKFSIYLNPKYIAKYKNPFIHGTLMFSKKLVDRLGGYDENFYYAQDYKLIHDAINLNFKTSNLKKVLYKLNDNENRISVKHIEEQNYFAECVRNNIKPTTQRFNKYE